MSTEDVNVTFTVRVSLDESKFTPEFMQEFRENFYAFYSIGDHYRHLAYLFVGGLCDNFPFIEGYGNAQDMGIQFQAVYTEMEIL